MNIAPTLLGDLADATLNNSAELRQQFLDMTLLPIIELFEDALELVLLNDDDRAQGYCIEFDTSNFVRNDIEKRFAALKTGIESGVLTLNEARDREGLPPVEGGDQPMRSVQVAPIDAPASPQNPEPNLSTLEKKTLPLEFKFADDAETTGSFEGLAAAYGNVDRGGDVIVNGAFAASLREHKAAGTKPALLWQHIETQPIGVIDSLVETPAGLEIKGRLILEVTKGAETYALVKQGAMRGLSIGFAPTKTTRDANGVRKILAAYLGEVSFVTRGMNDEAVVTNIKTATAAKGNDMTDEENGAAAGTADIEAKLAELESKTAKIDDLENEMKTAQRRADALELKMQRPGAHQVKDLREDLEKKAFGVFLRKGRELLGVEEVKSLQVANDTLGGSSRPRRLQPRSRQEPYSVLSRPRCGPRRLDVERFRDYPAQDCRADGFLGWRIGPAQRNVADLRADRNPCQRACLLYRRLEQIARRRCGQYRKRSRVRPRRRIWSR